MATSPVRRLAFDEVCDLFVALGAHNSPSEMHGLLSGQLAAGKRMDFAEWQETAKDFIDSDASFSKEDAEKLQFIYMSTLTALADDELGFYPLLPDDEDEIENRLTCLGLWSQGFLAGFALVEKRVEETSELVNDALNDLAAIAQVGLNDDEDWDESVEEDYTQLVEYIRLAAMNIFIEYAVEANHDQNATGNSQNEAYLSAESLFKKRQLH